MTQQTDRTPPQALNLAAGRLARLRGVDREKLQSALERHKARAAELASDYSPIVTVADIAALAAERRAATERGDTATADAIQTEIDRARCEATGRLVYKTTVAIAAENEPERRRLAAEIIRVQDEQETVAARVKRIEALLDATRPEALRRLADAATRETPFEARRRELKATGRERYESILRGCGPTFYDVKDEAEAAIVFSEFDRMNANAHHERAEAIERERERLERILAAVEAKGNVFARLGELWVVAHGGRRAFVPDCKGMPYVHAILSHAASESGNDGGLTPAELCGHVHKLPPELLPNDDTLRRAFEPGISEDGEENPLEYSTKADRDQIDHRDALDLRGRLEALEETRGCRITPEQYAEGIKDLKNQLQAARESKDKSKVREIQKALRELGEGDPKRQRRPPDPQAEKARIRVANAIRRAFEDLQKQHAAAAEHLRATVKTENGRWEYRGAERFTT